MTREQQLTSFGLFLQTARIERNMSIGDLAAETRIREEVLKRLEAEEHELLPDEVFVRGFIRSYAIAVGADVEEALERYDANRERCNAKSDRQTTAATKPKRFWLGFAAAVGAVLLMAGLTLHIYARLNVPPDLPAAVSTLPAEKEHPRPEEKPAIVEAAPAKEAATPSMSPTTIEEPQAPPEPYRLEIKAIEETWIKIIIDDQNAQEMTLETGDIRQVQAATLFNLLIGNAGGVELKLNDVPVALSGQSGQVVNLQLP